MRNEIAEKEQGGIICYSRSAELNKGIISELFVI